MWSVGTRIFSDAMSGTATIDQPPWVFWVGLTSPISTDVANNIVLVKLSTATEALVIECVQLVKSKTKLIAFRDPRM